jgi:hypothetical protein
VKHQRIPYKYKAEGENQRRLIKKTNTSRERGDQTRKKSSRKKKEEERSLQECLTVTVALLFVITR